MRWTWQALPVFRLCGCAWLRLRGTPVPALARGMSPMRRILRDQGLTLVMLGLFVIFLGAQSVTGFRVYNAERVQMDEAEISYSRYLRSGHFIEATFENWES